MFGMLDDVDLSSQHRDGKATLADKMVECGVDMDLVRRQMPLRIRMASMYGLNSTLNRDLCLSPGKNQLVS